MGLDLVSLVATSCYGQLTVRIVQWVRKNLKILCVCVRLFACVCQSGRCVSGLFGLFVVPSCPLMKPATIIQSFITPPTHTLWMKWIILFQQTHWDTKACCKATWSFSWPQFIGSDCLGNVSSYRMFVKSLIIHTHPGSTQMQLHRVYRISGSYPVL